MKSVDPHMVDSGREGLADAGRVDIYELGTSITALDAS